jgi:diguanylate cyclase (GGDEF)-like protein/PAS domain S-box-containing protein
MEPDADELISAVLESGSPAVLGPADLAGYPTAAWREGGDESAAVLVPLRGEGKIPGVIVATRGPGRPGYTDDDVAFLQALADTAAAAMGTAQLLAGSTAAVEELRRQAELVDLVSDVIMAWDAEGRIVNWNAAAERVYFYSAAEALGCDPQGLLATEFIAVDGEKLDRDRVHEALVSSGTWSGELHQRRADGAPIQVLCSLTGLTDNNGRLSGVIAVNRDVTDQRHKERLALQDALTGLPNRRYLLEHLTDALIGCAERGGMLAVLFCDLDGFKQVNDSLGHEAGDEVLRVTAVRLAAALRRHDLVARLGGDEFVAVAEDVGSMASAEDVARRLIEFAGEPITLGDSAARVVPSIGVAVVDGATATSFTAEDLIKRADAAMYVAKRTGTGVAFAS